MMEEIATIVPCLRKPYQDTRDRAAIRAVCRVRFMASPVQ